MVEPTADKALGEKTYAQNCTTCHGNAGAGTGHLGPYGAFPPYLYLAVDRLVPAQAGGTVEDFAKRTLGGVHATLPNMTSAAQLSTAEWKGLHAFVSGFEGEGEVIAPVQVPVPEAVEGAAPAEGANPAEAGKTE